jgi:DNA adenine methylase
LRTLAPIAHEERLLKPPLKWAGGKRWLVPHLQPIWAEHAHRRLVEPFCGGLAVALGLQPEKALLNDVSPHLIGFYQWLKRGFQITLPMQNDADLFYAHRATFNGLVSAGRTESYEAAELFYYLNRTCYNGLCRFNKSGGFNVPFGRYATISYTRDFTAYRHAFATWNFTSGPFESVPLEPDDFVYADPPYDVEFTSYTKEGFTWNDQVRLAEWLAEHSGPVVLSNQATPRIVDLYERLGFTLAFHQAPRLINSTGDRTPAREVVAKRGLSGRP